MYTRDPIKKTVNVTILTDVRPEFVSLVDHGAIQTPLKIVKADIQENQNGDTDMSKQQTRDRTVTDTAVSKSAVNTSAEVAKINFAAASFPDEATVTKWLGNGGYKDYTVSKNDTGFTAEWAIPEGYDTTALKSVKQVSGVEVILVPAVKAAEKVQEVVPANVAQLAIKNDDKKITKAEKLTAFADAKAELTKKFDYWRAYFEDEDATTIAGVFASGADSLPVGISELNNAFYMALASATETGDLSLIDSIAQEFADYYKKLIAAIPEAVDMEKAMTTEKTAKSDTPVTDVLGDTPKTLTESNVDLNAITTAITTGFASILASMVTKQTTAEGSTETNEEGATDVVAVAKADKAESESEIELVKTVKALQDRIDVLENRGQSSNNLGIDESSSAVAKKQVDPAIERSKKRGAADLLGI